MERAQTTTYSIWDNHNRLVADILTRYRTLMMLATVQAEEDISATPETMAVTGISMRMEFEGLNSSIKELLTLSRKIKELWVFGSLGQGTPAKKAVEVQIDAHVAQVVKLMNGIEGSKMDELAVRWGGTWEVLG